MSSLSEITRLPSDWQRENLKRPKANLGKVARVGGEVLLVGATVVLGGRAIMENLNQQEELKNYVLNNLYFQFHPREKGQIFSSDQISAKMIDLNPAKTPAMVIEEITKSAVFDPESNLYFGSFQKEDLEDLLGNLPPNLILSDLFILTDKANDGSTREFLYGQTLAGEAVEAVAMGLTETESGKEGGQRLVGWAKKPEKKDGLPVSLVWNSNLRQWAYMSWGIGDSDGQFPDKGLTPVPSVTKTPIVSPSVTVTRSPVSAIPPATVTKDKPVPTNTAPAKKPAVSPSPSPSLKPEATKLFNDGSSFEKRLKAQADGWYQTTIPAGGYFFSDISQPGNKTAPRLNLLSPRGASFLDDKEKFFLRLFDPKKFDQIKAGNFSKPTGAGEPRDLVEDNKPVYYDRYVDTGHGQDEPWVAVIGNLTGQAVTVEFGYRNKSAPCTGNSNRWSINENLGGNNITWTECTAQPGKRD